MESAGFRAGQLDCAPCLQDMGRKIDCRIEGIAASHDCLIGLEQRSEPFRRRESSIRSLRPQAGDSLTVHLKDGGLLAEGLLGSLAQIRQRHIARTFVEEPGDSADQTHPLAHVGFGELQGHMAIGGAVSQTTQRAVDINAAGCSLGYGIATVALDGMGQMGDIPVMHTSNLSMQRSHGDDAMDAAFMDGGIQHNRDVVHPRVLVA